MIVKIKCKGCGKELIIKSSTLNNARKVKKESSFCNKCEFRIMANIVAKKIVKGCRC